jgi:hypothetical protein
MKTIFTTAVMLLALSFGAIAQDTTQMNLPATSAGVADEAIRKGNWLVGASIASTGYNFSTNTFNILINPKAGYFFGQNIAIGGEVVLGLTAFDGGTNFQYGLTPFLRYYFTQGGDASGRIFQEVVFGFAGSSISDSDEDSPFSVLAGIRFGYAHFIARNVAIEPIIGYTYSKADVNLESGGGGLALSLGFQIYLPGKSNR